MTNEEIQKLMEFILTQQSEFRADLALTNKTLSDMVVRQGEFEKLTENRIQFIIEHQAEYEKRQAEFEERLNNKIESLSDNLDQLRDTVNTLSKVLDFVSNVAIETKQRVIKLETAKGKESD
ncbi:MAG: hypothetical protein FD167_1597 [bacterium]|nr:MAG: hypothetical protein FD167_1597 [bacterium]